MRIVGERRPRGAEDTPSAVALGLFDGLHVGHRQVVGAAVRYAAENGLRPAVFTFPPGGGSAQASGRPGAPGTVTTPGEVIPAAGYKPAETTPGEATPAAAPEPAAKPAGLILTPEQKHRELAALGVNTVYEPSFQSFCGLAPEAFFEQMLLAEFGARALFFGKNFYFGAARAGSPELLGRLCEKHGVALTVVPLAEYRGEPVSSTRIRAALAAGEMEDANTMLGRPYTLWAPVQHGQKLGSSLGFPTLNQCFPAGLQTPAYGVYATRTRLGDELHTSVTGWGTRPTVHGAEPTCETFIPGFSGNLYDTWVEVRFYKKIDSSYKFEGPQQLAEAVRNWAAKAQAFFT